MSDAQFRTLVRDYEVSPTPETALSLVTEYLRQTSNGREATGAERVFSNRNLLRDYANACQSYKIPLELTIFAPNPYAPIPRDFFPNLQSLVDMAQLSGGVQFYGNLTEEIVGQIEDKVLADIKQVWGIDPAAPPMDSLPEINYIGWLPEFDTSLSPPFESSAFARNDGTPGFQLVIVFNTEREQFAGYRTMASWYGIYRYNFASNQFHCVLPWNAANAPSEEPPPLATIRNNHPGVITITDNLDSARSTAIAAIAEIDDAVGEAQGNLDRRIYLYTMSEAGNLDYQAEQVEALPTISQGQFANLKEEITLNLEEYPDALGEYELTKPDGPHIRVWLSRMTREDGDEFDHAIEIEVYNPTEGRWEEYQRYQG